MPFNIGYYLHSLLFYLTTPALAVLLYFYGGQPAYFDLIFIVALGISCILCWRDKDTLGALVILLGFWLLSKPIYFAPDTLSYWIVIYGGSIGLSIYYIKHYTAKIVLILSVYSVAAETFWAITHYPYKPEVQYYIGLLAITVWARQLLFNRVFIAYQYFNYISGKTSLDTHIGSILHAYFWLILCLVLEYFVRHIAGIKDALFVYELFPRVVTFFSPAYLATIYMHYFYYQSQKYITA